MKKILLTIVALSCAALVSCGKSGAENGQETKSEMQTKVEKFASFKLTTDMSKLTDKEKELVGIFLDIAEIMDNLFWLQSYGNKADMDTIADQYAKEFAMINYGPWERLNAMKPFVAGFGEKPLGAGFYPKDMTEEEFKALKDEAKNSLYTVLRRDEQGKLIVKWYR
ncbi:MAG: Zn-dependent hydrolase, partial [Bacteroidales bacterium]|nr:Zn-dependent hydrolase [Bacteroidales bacterium]